MLANIWDKGIGITVCQQVEELIIDKANLSAATRKLLRQALPAVAKAVEILCPVVMEKTTNRVKSHYGPFLDLEEHDQLFIFVTNQGQYIGCACEWVPDELIAALVAEAKADMAPDQYNQAAWNVLYDLIKVQQTDNMTQILKILSLRIGVAGKAELVKVAAKIKAKGLLPAVLTIAVRDEAGNRSGGATGLITLPPALKLQV